jgi:diguanylate cyclase (GGDEF)-like protein
MRRARPPASARAVPRNTVPDAPDGPLPRQSLQEALRSAHLRIAMVSMAAVGLVLFLAAVLALRTYASHNLDLVARSIAYTVEAAVVFNDRAAMEEQLTLVARRESLRSVELRNANGIVLARFQPAADERNQRLLKLTGDRMAAWLMPQPTVAPVIESNRRIGEVRLHGDGAVFASFLASALAGTLLCLLLVALGLRQVMRRMQRDIVEPVQGLIAMTHGARAQHARTQRAPASQIAEFHELGEDFNSLLIEIELQQAQLAQENRSLSHLAIHDSLTGLYNRSFFSRRLARMLQDAEGEGTHIGVLYMDNDHFKEVNDRYGHGVGDLLLIEVAKRIRAQLREGDLVARLGGDEFAVLLAPVHHQRDALRIAEKINAAMAEPLPGRPDIVPSVSIGVAVYPQHGATAEHLLRAADRAMYRVKKIRRGTSRVFDDSRFVNDIPEH